MITEKAIASMHAFVRTRARAVHIKVATVAFARERVRVSMCVMMVRARLFGLLRVSLHPPPKKKKPALKVNVGVVGGGVGEKDTRCSYKLEPTQATVCGSACVGCVLAPGPSRQTGTGR